jgi:hypothetical protein
MRLTRVRLLLATGMVVAGTVAGTAVAASAAPARSSLPVLVQCNGVGQVKPGSSLQPGCMGSNQDITKIKWSTWTSSAFASGTWGVNNCTPSSSCGPSKFTKYPVLIVLWRAATRPHHPGQKYFSRMTVIFDGSGKQFPSGQRAVQTFNLRG